MILRLSTSSCSEFLRIVKQNAALGVKLVERLISAPRMPAKATAGQPRAPQNRVATAAERRFKPSKTNPGQDQLYFT